MFNDKLHNKLVEFRFHMLTAVINASTKETVGHVESNTPYVVLVTRNSTGSRIYGVNVNGVYVTFTVSLNEYHAAKILSTT